MTYARRKDTNQPLIIAALDAAGASVFVMHTPCDLLVGWRGHTILMEVKNLEGRGKRYTPAQVAFFTTWQGAPVVTVTSPDDAVTELYRVLEKYGECP